MTEREDPAIKTESTTVQEPGNPETKKTKPSESPVPKNYAEVLKQNTQLKAKIKTLAGRVKRQNEKLIFFAGDGYVPEHKLMEWREKCFQIGCQLDELRDAMREILLDVQTYPKKIKRDTLTIKNNHG